MRPQSGGGHKESAEDSVALTSALTETETEGAGWSVEVGKRTFGGSDLSWWAVRCWGGGAWFPTWFHTGLATLGHSAVLPADVGVGGEAPGSAVQASGVPAEVVRVLQLRDDLHRETVLVGYLQGETDRGEAWFRS